MKTLFRLAKGTTFAGALLYAFSLAQQHCPGVLEWLQSIMSHFENLKAQAHELLGDYANAAPYVAGVGAWVVVSWKLHRRQCVYEVKQSAEGNPFMRATLKVAIWPIYHAGCMLANWVAEYRQSIYEEAQRKPLLAGVNEDPAAGTKSLPQNG